MTKGKVKHSRDYREKVAVEATESGNVKATAIKYDLPATTVYLWVKN